MVIKSGDNPIKSVFPVCNKPYHTNKRILQKWEEIICGTMHGHERCHTIYAPRA